jgi:hypothetical protein
MEMLDQPTAPAKETAHQADWCQLGCDYVAMSCDFGPAGDRTVLVKAPVWKDLDLSDTNWQVTLPPHCFKHCGSLLRPCGPTLYFAGPQCRAQFLPIITQELTACSSAFYTACRPGFARVGRVCNFIPAEAAIEFNEQELAETVASLQVQVDEIAVKLKNK